MRCSAAGPACTPLAMLQLLACCTGWQMHCQPPLLHSLQLHALQAARRRHMCAAGSMLLELATRPPAPAAPPPAAAAAPSCCWLPGLQRGATTWAAPRHRPPPAHLEAREICRARQGQYVSTRRGERGPQGARRHPRLGCATHRSSPCAPWRLQGSGDRMGKRFRGRAGPQGGSAMDHAARAMRTAGPWALRNSPAIVPSR